MEARIYIDVNRTPNHVRTACRGLRPGNVVEFQGVQIRRDQRGIFVLVPLSDRPPLDGVLKWGVVIKAVVVEMEAVEGDGAVFMTDSAIATRIGGKYLIVADDDGAATHILVKIHESRRGL